MPATVKGLSPTMLTAFLRRVGVERQRARPATLLRILINDVTYEQLEQLADALYGRELAELVGLPVLPDPSCERAQVRAITSADARL